MVNWHQAAADADFKEYFGLMDNTAVYIGTAAEEIWTKEQFASFSKPYFDKGKAWDFKTLECTVSVNEYGSFVWFDELLVTWMGTCRGSGVLEKKEGSWKIKQYVLSVPIPNEDIQTVILAKKENDAIFLKKHQK
ncbi:nuclear transport factor 2 family protein [Polaribacter sp. ALD11]|uniref:nuclear transport factor 2 family protein n=1 Tax=Polaribacter sp. ALD11 TaxID=2058137 RepID=UPI001E35339D|nr:nuclear transport factor 2 family protein [Polaribacter sp. ALD11]